MPFLPDVPSENFPADLRYAVTTPDGRECRTFNIFHKLVHSPAIFRAVAETTAMTLGELALDPVLRELAICTVARLTGATYPHHRHMEVAKRVGIDAAKLLALPVYKEHPAFSAQERVVMAAAEELTERFRISPELKAQLAEFLNYEQRVELAWTIGFYNAVARVASACEVEVETVAPEGVAMRR
jgi:4-carboxymuconolactone decarboxylase